MKLNVTYPVSIAAVFMWIGFVGAISFMEAWLKFQAPGIDVPLGLGIGKLVFRALNIMEWVFVLCIINEFLFKRSKFFSRNKLTFFVAVGIVLLQTVWLLPVLNIRAEMVIAGQNPGESILHFIYVGFEIIKLICLFLFGIKLFKR
jgi:uncharacterized membrane protein (DUF485 family)